MKTIKSYSVFLEQKITSLDVVEFKKSKSAFVDRTDIYLNKTKVGRIDLEETEIEYAEVYHLHKEKLGKSIAIQYVEIDSKYQGRGVLKPTMNYIAKYAEENNYDSIFLKIETVSNTPPQLLIEMYSKYGYKHIVTGTEESDEDYYMVKYI